jgi:hypothetical protein
MTMTALDIIRSAGVTPLIAAGDPSHAVER